MSFHIVFKDFTGPTINQLTEKISDTFKCRSICGYVWDFSKIFKSVTASLGFYFEKKVHTSHSRSTEPAAITCFCRTEVCIFLVLSAKSFWDLWILDCCSVQKFCDHSSGSNFLNVASFHFLSFKMIEKLNKLNIFVIWITFIYGCNCWSCSLLINLSSIFSIHWLVICSLRRLFLSTTKIFSLPKKPEIIHIKAAGEETCGF